MVWQLVAKWLYWFAQGALPLGRVGARLARYLLGLVLALDPSDTRARGWRLLLEGVFARERGDAEAAVDLLREADGLLPDSDAVTVNLGISLAAAGKHEEAIVTLERALRGRSDMAGEAQVWTALAWSYLRSGRAPKALEACDRAADNRVQSRDTQVVRCLAVAAARGTVDGDTLGPLLRQCPRMLPLVLGFCQRLAHGGSHGTAKRVLRCLPGSVEPRAYNVIGRSALNEGDLNTALWAAKELQQLDAGEVCVPVLRSEVALQRGNTDAALRQAREAAQRGPRSGEALEQVVRVLVVRGERAAAEEAAGQALSAGTAGALSAGVLALRHLAAGEMREAQELFSVSRTGNALGCAFAHVAQGLIFSRQGATDRAAQVAVAAAGYLEGLQEWERTAEVVAWLEEGLEEAGGDARQWKVEDGDRTTQK